MEAFGQYLKEQRLKKNITISQIAKSTNINKKYLEALENEEFSVFPGEAYLKGFLRSYCTFLEINPDDIIKRYETLKMAEAPTPIEQLIPKPKSSIRPVFLVLIIILIVSAISVGSYIAYNKNKKIAGNEKKLERDRKKLQEKKKSTSIFRVSEEGVKREIDFKKNDIVEFNINEKSFIVNIKQLSPTVVISTEKGSEFYLIKSYPHKIDLDNDKKFDTEFILNSWNDKIANITVHLYNNEKKLFVNEGSSVNLIGENPEIIVNRAKTEKINLALNLLGPSFLRYKIDNSDDVENFFNQKELKIVADYRIILWLSNSGLVNLSFPKYEKEIMPGNKGEVSVKIINWQENTLGEYDLNISSLK